MYASRVGLSSAVFGGVAPKQRKAATDSSGNVRYITSIVPLDNGFTDCAGLADTQPRYITGPIRQGTNSLWPKRSAQVFSPDATRISVSKISAPTSATDF